MRRHATDRRETRRQQQHLFLLSMLRRGGKKRKNVVKEAKVEWKAEWKVFEDALRSGEWSTAADLFLPVWKALQPNQNLDQPVEREDEELLDVFCALFGGCYTFFQNGEHERALRNLSQLMMRYLQMGLNDNRSNGLVVGNPLFHLLAAKTRLALEQPDEQILEEVIRCCSIGGVEMLKDEPPKLMELLVTLPPPAPFKSWAESDETLQKKPNSCWDEYPFSDLDEGSFVMTLLESKWGPRGY